MITIINSETGNFQSVINMLKKIGYESILTDNYDIISKSKIIIFPGVGSFDTVMLKIFEKKIDIAIKNALENNSKLLGICVGMQALFKNSEEGKLDGLNLINGQVLKFTSKGQKFKIPHMGWNMVNFKKDNNFFRKLGQNRFYFVHSYYAKCNDSNDILGTTNYSSDFVSCIKKKNIFGVQFHPEKSHYFGKEFLKIFLEFNQQC